MPRTRTLAQLEAEVRQRADCEGDPHVTSAEIYRYINQSAAALHAMLADGDEGDFLDTFDVVTVKGQETLALTGIPAFYKLAHVHATVSGWVRSLERWTFERYTIYQNASTWGIANFPVAYRLMRDPSGAPLLRFAPTPDGAYPLRIFFVSAFVDLVNPTDVYDGRDGWEEWVVADAAVKCLIKAEESTRDVVAERDALLVRIKAQMQSADLDHPATVRDTVGTGYSPRRYEVR